jgi:hypothetical protein
VLLLCERLTQRRQAGGRHLHQRAGRVCGDRQRHPAHRSVSKPLRASAFACSHPDLPCPVCMPRARTCL